MTLCLHKLGGVVWYLVCWDANKNVDFKERSARLQRLNLSFELKKTIVAQRYVIARNCQRHPNAMTDGKSEHSTMLNGCQVEEKVILNCGFEDGAIVFLGMLFILIIYFVVPRACLMHGLWNADFVRCLQPAASIIFVQYNLLGGSGEMWVLHFISTGDGCFFMAFVWGKIPMQ